MSGHNTDVVVFVETIIDLQVGFAETNLPHHDHCRVSLAHHGATHGAINDQISGGQPVAGQLRLRVPDP
jgi:hypothetical protein